MSKKWDFSGYATRNDLLCADGRTIRHGAFKDCNGKTVPLVWMHDHTKVESVLGHALLENREDGVYAYGSFNDTEEGQAAKKRVMHGDVACLSIWANHLKQIGGDVIHGDIKEVSLVLAGANPGASIDFVMAHGDEEADELQAFYDENIMIIQHADDSKEEPKDNPEKKTEPENKEPKKDGAEKGKTIEEVINTMNNEQKKVLFGLIGEAQAEKEPSDDKDNDDNKKGDNEMKHNLFDQNNMQNEQNNTVLSHDDMKTIISDLKKYGSLKDSFMAHADEYGVQNLEFLFPEAKADSPVPTFISRSMDWVQQVMSSVHHVPFSRIKSMFADITEDEARAKGYIKGKLKKEEVFGLLKRRTDPTTIYKKQKMDRDDILDITDFEVVAWLKAEMRMMLDEEIARSILFGDGRLASSDDKVDENRIRSVLNDHDLFTIRWAVAAGSSEDEKAKNFIRAAVKSRKNYKGSGNPVLYTTEDMLTDCLLLEDTIGHKLYKTEAELATALRVSKIVTVPVMDGLKDKDEKDVYGVIVNLADYKVGADKGGSVNMFEDFDIDYNQEKYLIETRCSGALDKPFSAIVLRSGSETKSEEPGLAEAKKAIA